jgi:hypothetical protein
VNAGLPLTVKDMYILGEGSLYLIKPFNIELAVKMKGKDLKAADENEIKPQRDENADMIVDISIKPEIRGELDALKLSRLLQLINVVSATMNTSDCLASVSSADGAVGNYYRPLACKPSLLPLSESDHNLQISDLVNALHLHEAQADVPNQVR